MTILRVLGAVLIVVAALSTPAPADMLPDAVMRLEREGKFDEARALLAKTKTADAAAHLERLADVERAERVMRDYFDREMYVEAQQSLEPVLPKLDPSRDVYLILRVHRGLDEARKRGSDEAMASALLDRADALLARGAYARAKEVYASVAKSTAVEIGRGTLARARHGVANAERAALDAAPGSFVDELLEPIPGTARKLTQWIVWGAVALVLLLILAYVRRQVLIRPGNILELTDLTASGEARGPANHELNEALKTAIQRMISVEGGRGAATLEARPGVEGARGTAEEAGLMPPEGLAFVDPQLDVPELAKFNEVIQVAPAVQVGPIGLNPRQFWDIARWLCTPASRYTVTGVLFQVDGQVVLQVSKIDRRRNAIVQRWRAVAPASGGRAACLTDVAAQMVLAADGRATVTTSCASLRDYVAGLDALATAGDTPQALESARALLQGSVAGDPANWLARFHLAVVLRKLGDIGSAARLLRELDDSIQVLGDAKAAAVQAESLRAYCKERPEFPHVVRYHLASALAQSGASDDRREAEKMFGALVALGDSDEAKTWKNDRLLKLQMLGRSGETALLVSELRQKRTGQSEERIGAHMEWFDRHFEELDSTSLTDHAATRGIVLYAFGRYQYLHGNFQRAVKALKEATILVPRYADPHVNLAQVYLRWKRDVAHDWPLHVKASLDRALTIDPMNGKARYVYAKFYYSEAVRDLPKAESYLKDCLPHAGTLFLYGQVLDAQGKHAEAVQALDRSFAMDDKGADFRIRLYGECALAAAKAGAPLPMVEQACQRFDSRRKTVKDRKETARLEKLFTKLDAAIAERHKPPTPAPPAPIAPAPAVPAPPVPPPATPEPLA